MIDLKKILFPTDFSDFSRVAKQAAHDLATSFGCELHVLHVVADHDIEIPEFVMGLSFPGYVDGIGPHRRKLRQKALVHLQEEIPDSWKQEHSTIFEVRAGRPSDEIARYAQENNIDLILIGSHGRADLSHALLGSVAEKIVRNAPCPVLTIRPSAPGSEDDETTIPFPWGIHPVPVG